MKQTPIIFSTELIPKILNGTKTMTRRVIEPQPFIVLDGVPLVIREAKPDEFPIQRDVVKCPYGQVGDRLWVREAFYERLDVDPLVDPKKALHYCHYKADNPNMDMAWHSFSKCKPSIHMPRWASRITLEITEVRVERVQEITVNDAIKEGYPLGCIEHIEQLGMKQLLIANRMRIGWFQSLWDPLNAKHSWESNPWVWVISFKLS